jgi:hypothetical protein
MNRRAQRKRRRTRRLPAEVGQEAESVKLLRELETNPGTGPTLTGGDLDADWQRAASSGEEAVGGSVATPDQDVVDEIGQALGVPQPSDAQVRTSEEILRERDRRYWHLERQAADDERPS